jgi:hypothetical protein
MAVEADQLDLAGRVAATAPRDIRRRLNGGCRRGGLTHRFGGLGYGVGHLTRQPVARRMHREIAKRGDAHQPLVAAQDDKRRIWCCAMNVGGSLDVLVLETVNHLG